MSGTCIICRALVLYVGHLYYMSGACIIRRVLVLYVGYLYYSILTHVWGLGWGRDEQKRGDWAGAEKLCPEKHKNMTPARDPTQHTPNTNVICYIVYSIWYTAYTI